MLSRWDVAAYLLRRGQIDARVVVDGEVTIVAASSRNYTFLVTCRDGPCYLVKQGMDEDGARAVAREAAVYSWLQSHAQAAELLGYLPTLHGYAEEERVLLLGLVRDAESLRERHERRGHFAPGLAAALGDALALLHRIDPAGGPLRGDGPTLVDGAPWVLAIHRVDLSHLGRLSDASLRLLGVVQGSAALCAAFDGLRAEWTARAPIHGDLTADNCIVAMGSARDRRPALKVVDWETAELGDPRWDAGSVFADYLGCWVYSLPIIGDESPDRFLGRARVPLERMQPAMRAFWQAYVRRMGLDASEAGRWLRRATAYAAARLVQTAFARAQIASRPAGDLLYALQLALNVLQRPQEAIVHLLGIAFEE